MNTQAPPLTVEEYHRLCETGAIAYDARTELIRGQIHPMIAKGTPHTVCCSNLLEVFFAITGGKFKIRSQDPITLPNVSEPEPDLVIAQRRNDNYLDSHPSPEDIVLLVEVADSSLAFDRDTKLPLYRECGIELIWLVNVPQDRIEVYGQSGEGEFYGRGEFVEFEGRAIAVDQILP